jgi:hypothetical protein
MTTRRREDIPLDAAIALAREMKASEHIVTVGMPFFSSSIVSWILHDVHDPQSQMPLSTILQFVASFSMSAEFKAVPVSISVFLTRIIPANPNL